jgi:L-alanine-DL-glutamate epimerase-like enolase superfamily enzyme
MSIKISNLEIFCVKIPLKKPMYLSERTIECAENIIVKIEADGIYGWGESASAPRMTGDTISGMKEIINRWIKPLILGKDIEDYAKIIRKIDNTIYSNSGSKFAVYSALLDLYCRIKKISLHELLGKKIRNDFKSMRILANKDINGDLIEAEEQYKLGIDFFKIKIGKRNLSDEIQLIKQIRNITKDSKLCLDSNNGLDEPSFKNFINEIKDCKILFIEQPFNNNLKLNTSSNICLDESIFSSEDIHRFKDTAQGINLKLIKFSDPVRLIQSADLANKLNLKINLSGKISETGIATNVLLNCAAVIPDIDWGLSTTNQYLLQDIVIDNKFTLEPITVDEYLLSHFTYNGV